MKIRRIVCLLVLICISFSLSACISDADIRPQFDPNYVWVCEDPFSYFIYGDVNRDAPGILVYAENEYYYFMVDGTGPSIDFALPSAFSADGYTPKGNLLLYGIADYEEGYFVYTIEEDYLNIFGGEVKTMTFVRMSKEEFEEKHGSVIEFETAEQQTIW